MSLAQRLKEVSEPCPMCRAAIGRACTGKVYRSEGIGEGYFAEGKLIVPHKARRLAVKEAKWRAGMDGKGGAE